MILKINRCKFCGKRIFLLWYQYQELDACKWCFNHRMILEYQLKSRISALNPLIYKQKCKEIENDIWEK